MIGQCFRIGGHRFWVIRVKGLSAFQDFREDPSIHKVEEWAREGVSSKRLAGIPTKREI